MLNESPILQIPEGLRSLTSLTAYDERSAKFITDAKYRNSRTGLMTLARWSARMLPDEVADEVGLVTWAPTTNQRRRERGFDQAQIIAGIVGRTLGVPTRCLLRRSTGAAQTGRTRIERLNGPVFRAVGGLAGGPRSVTRPRKSVLIVDDVCTTGATLSAAAGALASVGHGPLHGLVIARTPLPGT